ncbi:MAG TPA: hypothetical protein VL096_19935 [Pirellulaceae bacterium]|nr:hypothetical protein [Pirellulaceae bacterium]
MARVVFSAAFVLAWAIGVSANAQELECITGQCIGGKCVLKQCQVAATPGVAMQCATADCATCGSPVVSMFLPLVDDVCQRIGVDFDFNIDGGPTTCELVAHEADRDLAMEVETQTAILEVYSEFLVEREKLRDQFEEQKMELLTALLETKVENAKLAAQVEFANERQMLAIENAVLKEKIAGQVAPSQPLVHADALHHENAALKAHIANLEKRLSQLEQPVSKSAEKATAKRKR